MPKKVMASTSGMVMPTTSPGRISMYQPKRPPLCQPSDTKLTINTINTASINTAMNSPTELLTACGWFCKLLSLTPAGKDVCKPATACSSEWPRLMMSPPLVMDTPSAITCWP